MAQKHRMSKAQKHRKTRSYYIRRRIFPLMSKPIQDIIGEVNLLIDDIDQMIVRTEGATEGYFRSFIRIKVLETPVSGHLIEKMPSRTLNDRTLREIVEEEARNAGILVDSPGNTPEDMALFILFQNLDEYGFIPLSDENIEALVIDEYTGMRVRDLNITREIIKDARKKLIQTLGLGFFDILDALEQYTEQLIEHDKGYEDILNFLRSHKNTMRSFLKNKDVRAFRRLLRSALNPKQILMFKRIFESYQTPVSKYYPILSPKEIIGFYDAIIYKTDHDQFAYSITEPKIYGLLDSMSITAFQEFNPRLVRRYNRFLKIVTSNFKQAFKLRKSILEPMFEWIITHNQDLLAGNTGRIHVMPKSEFEKIKKKFEAKPYIPYQINKMVRRFMVATPSGTYPLYFLLGYDIIRSPKKSERLVLYPRSFIFREYRRLLNKAMDLEKFNVNRFYHHCINKFPGVEKNISRQLFYHLCEEAVS